MATDPLEWLRARCAALPEVTERRSHGTPTFFVGQKRPFVMFWVNHHEDGRAALWLAAPPGAQEACVAAQPDRYFRPPYVGHRGWLGVRVDGDPDLEEVGEHLLEAFYAIAPARLHPPVSQ